MLRHLAEQAKALPLPVSWEAHPGPAHRGGRHRGLKTRLPYSTGNQATELKVRILACMVGRDEDGKLTVRYTGRVMKSSVYALKAVSVGEGVREAGISRGHVRHSGTGLQGSLGPGSESSRAFGAGPVGRFAGPGPRGFGRR